MSRKCVDCGRESYGERCRACNGKHIQRMFAEALSQSDSEIIAMRDQERLSLRRIGDRLGISMTRAGQRVRDARRRRKVLELAQ